MKTTFQDAQLVSVDNGTIVLEVNYVTTTFKDASLVSIVDGNITINHPDYNYNFKDGDIVVFYNFTIAGKTIKRYKHQTSDYVYFHGFTSCTLSFSKVENSYLYPASQEEIEEFKIIEQQNNVYWDQSNKTYVKYPKLQPGYIVETADGKRYLTMLNEDNIIIGIGEHEWHSNMQKAFNYDEDYEGRIIKIYKAQICGYFNLLLKRKHLELIWER